MSRLGEKNCVTASPLICALEKQGNRHQLRKPRSLGDLLNPNPRAIKRKERSDSWLAHRARIILVFFILALILETGSRLSNRLLWNTCTFLDHACKRLCVWGYSFATRMTMVFSFLVETLTRCLSGRYKRWRRGANFPVPSPLSLAHFLSSFGPLIIIIIIIIIIIASVV